MPPRPPKPADPRRIALFARVRQKGTRPERIVAAALRALGVSYRLNVKGLPGSPDFANQRRKWAIFVQGCYWHHHKGCRRATVPRTNEAFWRGKFADNRARDARAIRALRRMGFRVGLVWECEALDARVLQRKLERVTRAHPCASRGPGAH